VMMGRAWGSFIYLVVGSHVRSVFFSRLLVFVDGWRGDAGAGRGGWCVVRSSARMTVVGASKVKYLEKTIFP